MTSRSNPPKPIQSTFLPAGLVLADKYVIETPLGEGGMAFVMAARHRELGELVAIKFLKPGQQNEEIVQRFAREARAMAMLRSPYTARIYDVGMSEEYGPYLVMELLRGEDVGKTLDRLGALPIQIVVDILIQAAAALAEAHSRGIVHRDVKPENIFLDAPDGNLARATVKLVDFGVSKASLSGTSFGRSLDFAKTTVLIGSPSYMAPEQIRGLGTVDCRVDIWSLGVVLYELLTNNAPFVAGSLPELSARILETEPVPVLQFCPDLPAEMVEALARCLAKNPADRFQSMNEVALALAPFASPRWAHLAEGLTDDAMSMSQSGSRPSALQGGQNAPASSRDRPSKWPSQMSTSQLAALSPSQLAVLSPSQLAALSSSQLVAAPVAHRSSSILLALAAMVTVVVVAFLLRPHAGSPPAAAVTSAPSVPLTTSTPVVFASEPMGASVELDGQSRGTTPLTARLKPGSHRVRLTLPNYEPFSFVVPVPSGGEVPPLPVVALRPSPVAAAPSEAPVSPTPAPAAPPPRRGTSLWRAQAASTPTPPVTEPPSQPASAQPTVTSRPRLIEEKSNVKIID